MVLSAKEARNRARLNTPVTRLVEAIVEEIIKACDEGKFCTSYWVEDENGYTVRHAAQALRSLGYRVTFDELESGALYVSWATA